MGQNLAMGQEAVPVLKPSRYMYPVAEKLVTLGGKNLPGMQLAWWDSNP